MRLWKVLQRARLLQLNVDSSLLFLLMFAFDHVNARERAKDLLLLLCGVCSVCALMFALPPSECVWKSERKVQNVCVCVFSEKNTRGENEKCVLLRSATDINFNKKRHHPPTLCVMMMMILCAAKMQILFPLCRINSSARNAADWNDL